MKKIAIVFLLFTEYITISAWSYCRDFSDFLNLSSINLVLHLEDLTHTDKGMAPLVVRFFHNKANEFFLILLSKYLLFWDIRFAVNTVSIVGYFGIFCGLYYIFAEAKKKWYHKASLIIILLIPFLQIIFEPHIVLILKLVLLYTPYFLFSAYGIWRFLSGKNKFRFYVVFILILLSIWWLVIMKSELIRYCVKL